MTLGQQAKIGGALALTMGVLVFSLAGVSGAIRVEPSAILGRALSLIDLALLALRLVAASLVALALWRSRAVGEIREEAATGL